jgi:hypothetical protein
MPVIVTITSKKRVNHHVLVMLGDNQNVKGLKWRKNLSRRFSISACAVISIFNHVSAVRYLPDDGTVIAIFIKLIFTNHSYCELSINITEFISIGHNIPAKNYETQMW